MNEMISDKNGSRELCGRLCKGVRYALLFFIGFVFVPLAVCNFGIGGTAFWWMGGAMATLFFLLQRPMDATADRYVTFSSAVCRESAEKYFSSLFFGKLLLSVGLLPLFVCGAFLCRRLSFSEAISPKEIFLSLCLTMVSVCVSSVFSPFCLGYALRGRNDLREAEKLVGTVIFAVYMWLIVTGTARLTPVACSIALLVSLGGEVAVRLLLCRNLAPELWPRKSSFSKTSLRHILSFGKWYALYEAGLWGVTGATVVLFYFAAGLSASVQMGFLLLTAGFTGFVCGVPGRKMDRQQVWGDKAQSHCFVTAAMAAVSIGFADAFAKLWLGENLAGSLETGIFLFPLVMLSAGASFFTLAEQKQLIKRAAVVLWGVCGAVLALLTVGIKLWHWSFWICVAVLAMVQLLWHGLALPLLCGKKGEKSFGRIFSAALRGYAGQALSLGLVIGMQSVYTVDSWVKLILMGIVILPATFGICYLCQYCAYKRKSKEKSSVTVDTGHFFLYNRTQE